MRSLTKIMKRRHNVGDHCLTPIEMRTSDVPTQLCHTVLYIAARAHSITLPHLSLSKTLNSILLIYEGNK